jgi:hypothetical protein
MGAFRVVANANEQAIRDRSRGKHPIVCPIAIKLGEIWFPHECWDDFALVILDWWIQRVVGLCRGDTTSAKLDFMDGPFEIDVQLAGESSLEIRCLERKASGSTVRATGSCSLAEFESEIVTAARNVLAGVQKAGMWNEACTKLQAFLDQAFPLQTQVSS